MNDEPAIDIRVKLSALWASVMFCYIYGDYFTLYVPGKLEGMIDGEFVGIPTTEGILVAAALLMAVPGVMVFLSLVMKRALNRWANMILGIVYSTVMLLTMLLDAWTYYLLLGVIEIGLTLLIFWHAWTWTREKPV